MTDYLPDPSSGFTSMLRHVAGDIDDRNMSPNNVIAAASHLLREAADRIDADAETIATHKAEADSLYQDGVRLGEQVAALTADLERTRQAWVNGDDPMCDDVCVVACKGPCGLFTGEPYDADDIREATVDGCRYCNGTGVRHEASNPEPCIHCGKDSREATTDAG